LEDANLKLSSVASDVMGVSVRDSWLELSKVKTTPTTGTTGQSRMRSKIDELERALTGQIQAIIA